MMDLLDPCADMKRKVREIYIPVAERHGLGRDVVNRAIAAFDWHHLIGQNPANVPHLISRHMGSALSTILDERNAALKAADEAQRAGIARQMLRADYP